MFYAAAAVIGHQSRRPRAAGQPDAARRTSSSRAWPDAGQQDIVAAMPSDRFVVPHATHAPGAAGRQDDDLRALCHGVVEQIRRRHGLAAAAGIGTRATTVAGLHDSYQDASTAVRLGSRLAGWPDVNAIDDMRIQQLLAATGQRPRGRFVDALTTRLRAEGDWPALRQTVIAWCETGFNLVQAAGVLHIHRNTLVYRLKRIARLADRPVRDHRATPGTVRRLPRRPTHGRLTAPSATHARGAFSAAEQVVHTHRARGADRMAGMAEVRIAHTADLDAATLKAARALLDDVFAEDLTDHDWEHALGGVHALAWEQGELVGHASVVQRRLLHAGRALRTGYVEGVGVRADQRGRGHGAAMMAALERVVRRAYDLGALSTTDEAADFYASRGWARWLGTTLALTPSGITRTEEEDGGIFVLPAEVPLDLSGELICDWRDGDVW